MASRDKFNCPMASSDKYPAPTPARGTEPTPPGQPMTMGQHMIDKGAAMMQSLTPVKQISQHVCTFALYSHDMSRQIETYHYITRLNQDFLQCPVYDSEVSKARLIGIEYIISDRLYEALTQEEQKLWHSHAYEIKSGLWVNPRILEMIGKPELENLAKTYGKFWCTWQVDRGDRLLLGALALMMSPQGVNLGKIDPLLVKNRDDKYNISTETIQKSRLEIEEPEWINP
ncbi:hypothetical protein REPUB_Repub13aG0223800 [Reevesia pubescens]